MENAPSGEENSDTRENLSGATPAQVEAARWLIRLTSGEATAADQDAFVRWRIARPEHARAAAEVHATWLALDRSEPRRRLEARRPAGRPWKSALAACLIAGFLAFRLWHDWRFDHVTAPGQRRTIALSDGSHIELNSDTALSVHFDAHMRRVALARGEAYFDVAHARLPFVVEAGSVRVRDVGTAFAVRRDGGHRVQIIVERGEVEAQDSQGRVRLEAGEALVAGSGHALRVTSTDAEADLAWRRGRLLVVDQTLGSVVQTLNRYRRGVIVITNPAVAARRINAVVDLAHIDEWLMTLPQVERIELLKVGPLVWIH